MFAICFLPCSSKGVVFRLDVAGVDSGEGVAVGPGFAVAVGTASAVGLSTLKLGVAVASRSVVSAGVAVARGPVSAPTLADWESIPSSTNITNTVSKILRFCMSSVSVKGLCVEDAKRISPPPNH